MPSAGFIIMVLVTGLVLAVSFGLVFNDRILPNVFAGGISLGGLTEVEAANTLRQRHNRAFLP